MLPLFVLLVALGGTGTFLIYRLGNGIDEILRENYASVIAMREASSMIIPVYVAELAPPAHLLREFPASERAAMWKTVGVSSPAIL